MEQKKATKTSGGGESAPEEPAKAGESGQAQTGALDVLKAHYSALTAMLSDLPTAQQRGNLERLAGVYEACRRHMQMIDDSLVPLLEKAGAGDEDLRKAVTWHDVAKIVLADLGADWVRERDRQAKQAIFVELMADVLKREQQAETGVVALAETLGADLASLTDQLRAGIEPGQGGRQAAMTPPELNVLRLEAFGVSGPTAKETNTMNRHYEDNRRQDYGRGESDRGRYGRGDDDRRAESRGSREEYRGSRDDRESGRGSGYRDDERGRNYSMRDDDRYGMGSRRQDEQRRSSYAGDYDERRWQGRAQDDDERNGRWGQGNDRPRDSQGRFMSDDDDDRGHNGRSRAAEDRPRDSYGRFMSDDDDDDRRGGGRSRSAQDRPRDSQGRFMSDDDDDDGRSRSARSRYDDDDDDNGQSGWFGDREGHAEAARRGWEHRRR